MSNGNNIFLFEMIYSALFLFIFESCFKIAFIANINYLLCTKLTLFQIVTFLNFSHNINLQKKLNLFYEFALLIKLKMI